MSVSDFQHPWWFLVALVPAALVAGYVLALRSRRRRTVRFGNAALVRSLARSRRAWLAHVPAALLVVALLALTVALAGPQANQKVARNRATVVLVVDCSLSMEATDVAPTRLKAAQAAGTKFAGELTPGINLGLVAFSGTATMLVAPTTDRAPVVQNIQTLTLGERTATGEGIFAALQGIQTFAASLGGTDKPPPARIVLLSDGKETVPPDESAPRGGYTAADKAKAAGVPVSTISFGTTHGTVEVDGQVAPVPVDDDSLREIAQRSGGDFYTASSLDQLNRIYDTLQEQIGYEWKKTDASRPWLVAGAILAMLAAAGSLAINRSIP